MDKLEKALKENGLSLRPYQVEGVRTYLDWFNSNHGGIIADEMGLGKTCQAVLLLYLLSEEKKLHRHLVVSPLSVVDFWLQEIKRFGLGRLKVICYYGDVEQRKKARKMMKSPDWNICLTTYQYAISDMASLHIKWDSVIVDEAHRLKNSESLLHKTIREVRL
ncbi:hypothetical protein AB6A40_003222 [Gnathostoma spinigerum]|uniref:Helicase ATP-binding domain-containing protein n=1 Tax=Gnathostoma spinigerum TaxID=75299 RepID=A0ABD6EHS0_9BILA